MQEQLAKNELENAQMLDFPDKIGALREFVGIKSQGVSRVEQMVENCFEFLQGKIDE